MIREQARIVAIEAGRMRLVPLVSGCGSCGKSSDCGTAKLAKLLPSASRELELPAAPAHRVGDVLELGLPEAALLLAALLAYLPPLLGLVAGALLISPAGAALQPLGALLGTVAGFSASRLLSRLYAGRLTPVPLAPPADGTRTIITLKQELEHE